MIGVVLWSDASDRKAVIWCEDQGDLAFLNSADDIFQSDAFFDAGDVVQFDMEVQASMRRAHNPRLVLEQAGVGLPDALRQSAQSTALSDRGAKVIPFAPRRVVQHTDVLKVSEA
ncbi:hypothetical protein So717_20450 [Roseobacter cerasinus]|uniref:Uncharacterized protein n=1 Tax=Roseobacter cerasinus TaxID=2602289 RepID=A0A640VRI4_9RHOB|nr:hypothetical protein [Roseobacter cerasinus]GFE50292.1 hypothetical protein So717_20450 [Roseobacter cerasinus]